MCSCCVLWPVACTRLQPGLHLLQRISPAHAVVCLTKCAPAALHTATPLQQRQQHVSVGLCQATEELARCKQPVTCIQAQQLSVTETCQQVRDQLPPTHRAQHAAHASSAVPAVDSSVLLLFVHLLWVVLVGPAPTACCCPAASAATSSSTIRRRQAAKDTTPCTLFELANVRTVYLLMPFSAAVACVAQASTANREAGMDP